MNSNNDPPKINVSASTAETKGRLQRLSNRRVIFLILIVVLIAGAIAWYFYDKSNEETSLPTATTRTTSFDATIQARFMAIHYLQGTTSGAGMKFNLPWEGFMYVDSPPERSEPRPKDTPEGLSEIIPKAGNNVELGERIFTPDGNATFQSLAAARIVPPAEQAQYVAYAYFKSLLAKWSFNTSEDSSQLGLGMSAPKEFTNSAIKSGGQMYDISASMSSGVNSGLISSMIGQLIEVKGQNANYYLLIIAIDENWNNNPKTWQLIRDSIKVDQ